MDFVRKLANWRKGQPVIHNGKMMHYGPQDNTWVYFRYNDDKKVLVAFNNNSKEMSLDVDRFREMLSGVASGTDALTGKTYDLREKLVLAPRAAIVLELAAPR